MTQQQPQKIQGFFLPQQVLVDVIEVLDELPRGRVKRICRELESLQVITVEAKPQQEAPPPSQPSSPPGNGAAGKDEAPAGVSLGA